MVVNGVVCCALIGNEVEEEEEDDDDVVVVVNGVGESPEAYVDGVFSIRDENGADEENCARVLFHECSVAPSVFCSCVNPN